MKIITWCYNCQQRISFDNVTRNRNGVAIPVDDYGNLHSCRHKKRKPGFPSQKCFRCGQVIHFDKNYRSISGKYIPLDWNSGKRHECNETPDLEVREHWLSQELWKKCNWARYVPGHKNWITHYSDVGISHFTYNHGRYSGHVYYCNLIISSQVPVADSI